MKEYVMLPVMTNWAFQGSMFLVSPATLWILDATVVTKKLLFMIRNL